MRNVILIVLSLLVFVVETANAIHTVAEITNTINKYDKDNDQKLGWKEYRKLIQNNIHHRLTRTQWKFVH